MSEYEQRTGRSKYFTIHKNDAGTEAYQDHYVHGLQAEIERLRGIEKSQHESIVEKDIEIRGLQEDLASAMITELRNSYEKVDKFRVTDGARCGWCYSFYDHFDIWWDDNTFQACAELSVYGIRKAMEVDDE